MSRVSFSANPQQESLYRKALLRERAWFVCTSMTAYLPTPKDTVSACDDGRFRENVMGLQQAWRRIEVPFFRQAKLLHHAKVHPTYRCHVSVFGPEGKYRRPNQLFLRLRTSRDKRLATEALAHELVHLFLAEFCAAKRCSYAEREGLVDAILASALFRQFFPQYRIQSVGRVPYRLLPTVLSPVIRQEQSKSARNPVVTIKKTVAQEQVKPAATDIPHESEKEPAKLAKRSTPRTKKPATKKTVDKGS